MDLQHLYFGRRASTRIRSELMAAVYDKALKQKDYSGAIHQLKPGFIPVDDPSITSPHPADSGKIVNMMSVDASRVSVQAGALQTEVLMHCHSLRKLWLNVIN